jgi:hypothetical protein
VSVSFLRGFDAFRIIHKAACARLWIECVYKMVKEERELNGQNKNDRQNKSSHHTGGRREWVLLENGHFQFVENSLQAFVFGL